MTAPASEHTHAVRLRDALHHIRRRVEEGKPVSPAELSVAVRKHADGGPALVSGLFLWMISTATAAKYRQAGRHNVAALLEQQALIALQRCADGGPTRAPQQGLGDSGRVLQTLLGGRRSINRCAWRQRSHDLDLLLSAQAPFALWLGITPWVCQNRDLRYRWTPDSIPRLAWLADCWDAYARPDLGPNDRHIGLADFPTYPDLC